MINKPSEGKHVIARPVSTRIILEAGTMAREMVDMVTTKVFLKVMDFDQKLNVLKFIARKLMGVKQYYVFILEFLHKYAQERERDDDNDDDENDDDKIITAATSIATAAIATALSAPPLPPPLPPLLFDLLLYIVKPFSGGRKIDNIPSIFEIFSQMSYICVQYIRRQHISYVSLC